MRAVSKRVILIFLAFVSYGLIGCGKNSYEFAKQSSQEVADLDPRQTPSPVPGPTAQPTPPQTPKPTPNPSGSPVAPAACPEIQSNNWSQVPTRPYPPFQGDPADEGAIEWMQRLAYGPVTSYGAHVQWAQANPYGVWPANEYVPPNENGFLIVPNALMVMIDSTTHGSGCHEGCQWDFNPVWELRGNMELLRLQDEGNRANLPSGNVFKLRFPIASTGSGTFAIRARIRSQTGQTVYTPEIKFCIKR